ncbi:restriction endonuclease subunit R [Oscillatoria amoena NRMC-F 0135]|nr:restriction endonuclease subunit R [Geitlerinema splendidum]MDL5051171.1 restriction endonuclease subunit R [Oscillatoria amoena NRMC-F 0135]
MVQILQASNISLGDLVQQFGLVMTREAQFFSEWVEASAEISDEEIRTLERVRSNFENLLMTSPLPEAAVKMVILSPLLDLAGFYQPPFQVKTEVGTQIRSSEADGIVVTGQIDVLVILNALWVIAIESKTSRFSLTAAIAQSLSYLLACPQSECFGLMTNGSDFVFLKLNREKTPTYSTSRVFSLLAPGNELIDVLRILKDLGNIVSQRRDRS